MEKTTNPASNITTYLWFDTQAEEAVNFYKSIFGGEFLDGIQRFSAVPMPAGQNALPEADQNLIMHITLPILGSYLLMDTDAPETMDFQVQMDVYCTSKE